MNNEIINENIDNSPISESKIKLNAFFYSVDFSHCSSCHEPSDEEFYFLLTLFPKEKVIAIFKEWVWNNVTFISYSFAKNNAGIFKWNPKKNVFPKFFDYFISEFDCLFFEHHAMSEINLRGSLLDEQYNMEEEFAFERLFGFKDIHTFELARNAEEESRRKDEEKNKKLQAVRKKYEEELKQYKEKQNKFNTYFSLQKEIETLKLEGLKEPEMPEILKQEEQKKQKIRVIMDAFKKEHLK